MLLGLGVVGSALYFLLRHEAECGTSWDGRCTACVVGPSAAGLIAALVTRRDDFQWREVRARIGRWSRWERVDVIRGELLDDEVTVTRVVRDVQQECFAVLGGYHDLPRAGTFAHVAGEWAEDPYAEGWLWPAVAAALNTADWRERQLLRGWVQEYRQYRQHMVDDGNSDARRLLPPPEL